MKVPIILVLGRSPYKKVPQEFVEPLNEGRLFIVSLSKKMRQTRDSAFERNKYIVDMADEIVFGSLNKESSLYPLYEQANAEGKSIKIL